MAKKDKEFKSTLHIPGVTNYDKLVANHKGKKATELHRYDPFGASQYSKDVVDKLEAEPLDPRFLDDTIYSQLLLRDLTEKSWKHRSKDFSLFDLEPKRKRQRLQSMSSYDMIDEVLTKLTDEVIVEGTGEEFPLRPEINRIKLEESKVSKSIIDKIEKSVKSTFEFIYNAYGFRDKASSRSLWNFVYEFLIEGKKGYTFVLDNMERPKKIIGAVEIDPYDMDDFYKDGVKYWVQKQNLDRSKQDKIILFDSQIVIIDWSSSKANARFSYLERLVRSFNNARIMDETRVIWSVTNAMFRTLFSIPTGGMSRIKAAQTLATEQNRYHDDINYNSDTGELSVNGQNNMKFSKEYWMSNGDQGSPSIQTMGGDGPDLNDSEMNEYFNKKFYRNSRMPFSRFDATSGETWNLDTRSQLREEITFGRFVNRIRGMIEQIFIKPILLQLSMDLPEVKDDPSILNSIQMRFESYSIFEELMNAEVLSEKIRFISDMREALQQEDADGDIIPFFSQKWLVEKYLPEITEDDIKSNRKYLMKEQEEMFEFLRKKGELMKELEDKYGIKKEDTEVDF